MIFIFFFYYFLLFCDFYFIIHCRKLQVFLINYEKKNIFYFHTYNKNKQHKLFRGDTMSNNMDDLFANVKKMVDSGNIPDDIKQMMNNLTNSNNSNNINPNSSNNSNNSNNNANSNNNDLNNILSQVSPEMINNLSNMLNSNNRESSQGASQNNNFNLDMNTIMKMKSMMENMNTRNDPRANLLYSLKPYLRDSKKDKLDQYVNLLNVSKIAEFMNKNNNNTDNKQ